MLTTFCTDKWCLVDSGVKIPVVKTDVLRQIILRFIPLCPRSKCCVKSAVVESEVKVTVGCKWSTQLILTITRTQLFLWIFDCFVLILILYDIINLWCSVCFRRHRVMKGSSSPVSVVSAILHSWISIPCFPKLASNASGRNESDLQFAKTNLPKSK